MCGIFIFYQVVYVGFLFESVTNHIRDLVQ